MHTSYQFHTSEACNTFLSDAVQDEITRLLGITIKGKGTTIRLSGAQEDVDLTSALLDRCQQNGGGLQAGEVEAELIRMRNPTVFPEILRDHRGKLIRPLTKNQNDYVESLYTNQLTFGTGPAGVGKTYLATAVAISRLLKGDVERVIITRPAVEAGEKLGFLPGDLNEKMEPYLVPLRDAMNEFVGKQRVQAWLDAGVVEIAPIAYLRGRTLKDAAIIIDEAQNTSDVQMKLILTRMGFNTRIAINGDTEQTDIRGKSGLAEAVAICKNIPGVAAIRFTCADNQRSPLVAAVIAGYAKLNK